MASLATTQDNAPTVPKPEGFTDVDWDAVERVVGKDKADLMKKGEGFTGPLDISGKKITPEGCKILAPALMKMTGLILLYLNQNQYGDEGLQFVAPALRTMTNLEKLYLSTNNIGDEGCRTIAPALRTMTNLKRLYLSKNNIGDEGCRTIASALPTMTNLRFLSLSYNNIGDNGIASICKVLPEMVSLDSLGLNGNKIGNVGCQGLLELVENGSLPSLTDLWLEDNTNISPELKNKFGRVWEAKGKSKYHLDVHLSRLDRQERTYYDTDLFTSTDLDYY